jgi:hypothetical protein
MHAQHTHAGLCVHAYSGCLVVLSVLAIWQHGEHYRQHRDYRLCARRALATSTGALYLVMVPSPWAFGRRGQGMTVMLCRSWFNMHKAAGVPAVHVFSGGWFCIVPAHPRAEAQLPVSVRCTAVQVAMMQCCVS